jgi:2-oxo-4-hydroxy-4-carboxy-5-ureidoimidazoline decarboxylase
MINAVLESWNHADQATAMLAMLACCGARRWAEKMVALRPFDSIRELSEAADRAWAAMEEQDWLEAFACHPRIGARTQGEATAGSQGEQWSAQEQSSTSTAPQRVLARLAEGNAAYERRFGFTYIVCATGKTAEEMLAILNRRLAAGRDLELREAAEQQRQIMQIRLGKWLME